LVLLVVAAVPDAITNIYVSTLRVRTRLRQAAALNIGMAVLSLVLAWLLLPTMGITGAGLAWLIAQIVGSAVVGGWILQSRGWSARQAPSRAESRAASPMEIR
jgi:Na+-driven multidrug efflux pump